MNTCTHYQKSLLLMNIFKPAKIQAKEHVSWKCQTNREFC